MRSFVRSSLVAVAAASSVSAGVGGGGKGDPGRWGEKAEKDVTRL